MYVVIQPCPKSQYSIPLFEYVANISSSQSAGLPGMYIQQRSLARSVETRTSELPILAIVFTRWRKNSGMLTHVPQTLGPPHLHLQVLSVIHPIQLLLEDGSDMLPTLLRCRRGDIRNRYLQDVPSPTEGWRKIPGRCRRSAVR